MKAVRASLGLIGLGSDRLTFPLLAAVYRAVLGGTDFSLHLAGPTGCYKTEVLALLQQHFGSGMDARHLPASWFSTANALEGLAFAAKDTLLSVDDFVLIGSSYDAQRFQKEADRLLRAQGNHAGRQRMRADTSLRPAKPPRCLIASTGEDIPRGQSLRARLLVLEVSPGDFGPQPPNSNPKLSACQKDASAGRYAEALAGFARWLASRFDLVQAQLREDLEIMRDWAKGDGLHPRTPGIVSDLALGLHYLLQFAASISAISEQEQQDLWVRGWNAFTEAASWQADHIGSANPAGTFMRFLSAAVASGCGHFADRHGNAPPQPLRWGWRRERVDASNGTGSYHPQGLRIGWVDEVGVYLEPEASFAVAQRFARDHGERFLVSARTLRLRLKENGQLVTTDTARKKLTVRKTL